MYKLKKKEKYSKALTSIHGPLYYLFDHVCKTAKSILAFCESKYTLNNKPVRVSTKYLGENIQFSQAVN